MTTTTLAQSPVPVRRSRARGPLVHLAVLGVAATSALFVWTREQQPAALAQGDVSVWSGRGADVTEVALEAKTKKLVMEAKKDAVGRYFIATVERFSEPADGGAPAAPSPPSTFVSVAPADKLAEALVPLKALRSLGHIADDKLGDFGLAGGEGTVRVIAGGAARSLLLGSTTPGGSDRYVKDLASGEVFVVRGEALHNLEAADAVLVERDLHEWRDTDVTQATLTAGGKTRSLVRSGPDSKRFWADPSKPDENDETLSNWMSKLDRLRPSEFVGNPPAGRQTVVHVDYSGKAARGFLELVKVPNPNGKSDYLLQTERTRLFAKVPAALAEQIEQDVSSVVK